LVAQSRNCHTSRWVRHRSFGDWVTQFAKYEADSIVLFVANSPVMSFFYHYEAPEYRQSPKQGRRTESSTP
jgi:hypothetical protein